MQYIRHSSDVLLTSRPPLNDERESCQHLPLSATVSLPSSATCSSTPRHQWRRSGDSSATTPPPLPSLDHRPDEDRSRVTSRYKTELCRTYAEHGTCRYGDKCQFAHGRDDLRAVARHPKYKTDLCRTYHTTGLCPYGPRCHFIHNEDEARCRPTAPLPPSAKRRDVDLAVRELELRLALLNLYQQEKLASQSATSSYIYVNSNSDQNANVTVALPAAPQWHVPLGRRQSVPTTVSSPRPSSLVGVSSPPVAGALDSVGNSPSSSSADDYSPPPLSPTFSAVDDTCRHLCTSNDRLTALLMLAAKLRLHQGTTTAH